MTPPQPQPSWFDHVDLMQCALVGALACIVYFFKRTLNNIDASQRLLFKNQDILRNDLTRLGREFSDLRGQHNAIHKMDGHQ